MAMSVCPAGQRRRRRSRSRVGVEGLVQNGGGGDVRPPIVVSLNRTRAPIFTSRFFFGLSRCRAAVVRFSRFLFSRFPRRTRSERQPERYTGPPARGGGRSRRVHG